MCEKSKQALQTHIGLHWTTGALTERLPWKPEFRRTNWTTEALGLQWFVGFVYSVCCMG